MLHGSTYPLRLPTETHKTDRVKLELAKENIFS